MAEKRGMWQGKSASPWSNGGEHEASGFRRPLVAQQKKSMAQLSNNIIEIELEGN